MSKKLTLSKEIVPEQIEVPEQRIVIEEIPPLIQRFQAMPEGLEKNYRFSKLAHYKQFRTASILKRGNDIYLSTTGYTLSKNKNSYYLKPTSRNGLSFKDNKLNIWFGAKVDGVYHLPALFNEMRWNFIEKEAEGYITKGILEKLFKGKITNTRDLLKAYAKSVRINASKELLYQAVKKGLDKLNFYKYGTIAENPDHFLESYINSKEKIRHFFNNNLTSDLLEQFSILDRKINFRWSDKRMREEHDSATRILMQFEVGKLSEEKILYPNLNIPQEFEILDNQKRTFMEGKLMSHCIYTNYWKQIESGKYIAFHVKYGNEEATLGLNISDKGELKFSQVYKYKNATVSPDLRAFCLNWLEKNKDYNVSGKETLKLRTSNVVEEDNIDIERLIYAHNQADGNLDDFFENF